MSENVSDTKKYFTLMTIKVFGESENKTYYNILISKFEVPKINLILIYSTSDERCFLELLWYK